MGIWFFGSTNLVPRPHDHWKERQTVITKKGVKPRQSNFVWLPDKENEEFEVIAKDEDDSIPLDEIWHFFIAVHPFFVDIRPTYFFYGR